MFTAPVMALLLAAQPADTYSLQWKLKEGDVFYNKATTVQEQTIETMGRSVEQRIETTATLKFKVKSVAKNATVVEMTFLESKTETKGLPAGADVGDKLKGLSFTATLNDKMEVTKFDGYDKFLDALADGDDAKKKLMKAIMPESTLRRSFDQTFLFAPNKPIAVGDKWDRSEKLSLGPLGNMDMKFACKLDGVKGNVASVSTKGEMTWKAGEASDDLPFKISKMDIKTDKLTSDYRFDLKAGRPIDTKVEMQMNGTMTIELAGMEVEMKMKQKMTVSGTLTDKNPLKD